MISRLRGQRLHLAPLDANDEALYLRLYGDPEVMQHIGRPQDADTAAKGFRTALKLNAATPPVRWFWVIREHRQEPALGLLGLSLDQSGSGEVGVVLPAEHQGRGIATEAIATLADHAFGTLQLQRLHTRHDATHEPAAGLMAALGFERTPAQAGQWCWQLTPARWAASPRRQAKADPLP